VLGAAALLVVLAVVGVVAVSKLSAKPPAPSPTPTGAATSHSAAPGPTASSPPATQSQPAAASGPAAIVQDYFAAINKHDCATAWNLGGNNISAAKSQNYQQFCQGFSTTSHDDLTVDSVSGNTVAVTIVAHNTDGSSQTFRGTYVVGNGVIDSATVQAG
jgi:hypothetical protein